MEFEQLVFPGKHQCVVRRVAVDDALAPDKVLIENHLSLVSAGTELAIFNRTHRSFERRVSAFGQYPFVPGYSAVGTVVKCGRDVDELQPGQRVVHGGKHGEFSVFPAASCVRVDAQLADEDAVFLPMIRIAMTAPRVAPVRFGEAVVVVGMGIVGNLCAQLCQLAGAAVVGAADLLPERLERAAACGLSTPLDLKEKPLQEWGKSLAADGPSLMVEAVGAGAAITSCLETVARHGRVVLLGSPRAPMTIDPYVDIHRAGVEIIGAHTTRVSPEVRRQDDQLILQWLRDRRLVLEPLRTHTLSFRDAKAAYEGLRDDPKNFMGVLLNYEPAAVAV